MPSTKTRSWFTGLIRRQPRHTEFHSVYRHFHPHERAVVEWLLKHAASGGAGFVQQLDLARVKRECECGCPSVELFIPPETKPAEASEERVASAIGIAKRACVIVTLSQRQGYLTNLDVKILSPHSKPYNLPSLDSLVTYSEL